MVRPCMSGVALRNPGGISRSGRYVGHISGIAYSKGPCAGFMAPVWDDRLRAAGRSRAPPVAMHQISGRDPISDRDYTQLLRAHGPRKRSASGGAGKPPQTRSALRMRGTWRPGRKISLCAAAIARTVQFVSGRMIMWHRPREQRVGSPHSGSATCIGRSKPQQTAWPLYCVRREKVHGKRQFGRPRALVTVRNSATCLNPLPAMII